MLVPHGRHVVIVVLVIRCEPNRATLPGVDAFGQRSVEAASCLTNGALSTAMIRFSQQALLVMVQW
jgi:hypothetical protein